MGLFSKEKAPASIYTLEEVDNLCNRRSSDIAHWLHKPSQEELDAVIKVNADYVRVPEKIITELAESGNVTYQNPKAKNDITDMDETAFDRTWTIRVSIDGKNGSKTYTEIANSEKM